MTATSTPVRSSTSSTPTPVEEQEVLDLISRGLTDREISADLALSSSTARRRVERMYDRLGAENRGHAVRLGFERQLLTPSNVNPLPGTPSLRQRQVLELMSHGKTSDQIAERLELAENYVRKLARDLYRRIGARSRPHAIRLGFEHGLLTPAGGERR
ncbi:regulatory protein, luxR family [Lentzea albidocapillata subsp. violacea]|uniref:Regulatory protein, luxR family n=1 Tax=Lentzea albidocapillata subsp. violacea TaxID=128104 RepID=A0A1G9AVM1_9PSEU|nr:helix-turn-helix transcriptional regulator [Lentzea albidocapillata]SDK31278.1 regulatory protein, luxR family [Lentzea albidocapillata subsp. violacea]